MMNASTHASLPLLRIAAASWQQHVIDANPAVRWRVFMHSWSPEVAAEVRALYHPWLAATQHERTLYVASGPGLYFNCRGSGCARTASQVLSMAKALLLKQQYELQHAFRFSVVVVTRHDLVFRSAFIVPHLWALPDGGHNEVRLLSACDGRCGGGEKVPMGCRITGPDCAIPFFYGWRRAYRAQDLLFVGSSQSTRALSMH